MHENPVFAVVLPGDLDQLVHFPAAALGVHHDLGQLLIEVLRGLAEVDSGVHCGEEEAEELFQIIVDDLFPATVHVGRGCAVHKHSLSVDLPGYRTVGNAGALPPP